VMSFEVSPGEMDFGSWNDGRMKTLSVSRKSWNLRSA
jgi:hypothetical protein